MQFEVVIYLLVIIGQVGKSVLGSALGGSKATKANARSCQGLGREHDCVQVASFDVSEVKYTTDKLSRPAMA